MRPSRSLKTRVVLFAATFVLAASVAGADWLVTKTGTRIETKGTWQLKGDQVHYTDTEGRAATLPAAEAPKVILYSTAWCGYCRKTRELLTRLQVPFGEKDVEKSDEGRAEYLAKGKGYRGVPLTDIGGTIVHGYEPVQVTQLVNELQKKEKAAAAGSR
jgi:glutaredoxin